MYCSFASDTLKVTSNLRKLFSIFFIGAPSLSPALDLQLPAYQLWD
jgi:hypothetical protein